MWFPLFSGFGIIIFESPVSVLVSIPTFNLIWQLWILVVGIYFGFFLPISHCFRVLVGIIIFGFLVLLLVYVPIFIFIWWLCIFSYFLGKWPIIGGLGHVFVVWGGARGFIDHLSHIDVVSTRSSSRCGEGSTYSLIRRLFNFWGLRVVLGVSTPFSHSVGSSGLSFT